MLDVRRGFSLVELTVVLAIIGILASFGVNSYINSQKRGRDNKRQADLEIVRSALEQYRYDKGGYPLGNDRLSDGSLDELTTEGYLQAIPDDVLPNQDYFYKGLNNSGSTCGAIANCVKYALCAKVEILPASADTSNCGTNQCVTSGGSRNCNYKLTNL